jgi:hypothetical protein
MSALIQSFSSLSLSSRTLRGDAKVASPSTRAMPKNRTAVVTEAVRCFFLFFCSQFFFAFWPSSWCSYCHGVERDVGRRRKRKPSRGTFTISLRERDSFAFDSVARRRLCSSRDLQVVASLVARAEAFFVFRPQKNFIRERDKSLSSGFWLRKKPLSLFLCV